ncbi:MAG: hypothetical protein IPM69_06710 [Ignavibacteria bacterium]|nr:hypothetical protein [Ignavibacteria bacterium]
MRILLWLELYNARPILSAIEQNNDGQNEGSSDHTLAIRPSAKPSVSDTDDEQLSHHQSDQEKRSAHSAYIYFSSHLVKPSTPEFSYSAS